jgi:hypothetical protein
VGGWGAFRSDVVASIQVWARVPLVPAVGVVLAVAGPVARLFGGGHSLVVSLVLLSTVGFYGTQRLAFARAQAGFTSSFGMLFNASLHYWGRFVALGLIMAFLMLPVWLIVVLPDTAGPGSLSTAAIVIGCAAAFLLDLLATFATPALVFRTPKAWAAFKEGRRLLAETWSETKYHALLPPLVPLLVGQMISGDDPVAGVVVSAFGAVVAVVARGAHTIAFLRYRPIAPAALPPTLAGEYSSGSLWAEHSDRQRQHQRFREEREAAASQEPDLRKISETLNRREQNDT